MNENISEKKQRLGLMKALVKGFCETHLNEELTDYALKLCETLGRRRKISITQGKIEIWAAAVVYVIARLNFLFDLSNPFYISSDTICNFFETKKSTTSAKATDIEKICRLPMGAEGFCSPDITDAFTIVDLPSGIVIPKNMLPKFPFSYEIASDEESEELERLLAEKEKSAALAKQKRKAAKKIKKDDKQISLFGDSDV